MFDCVLNTPMNCTLNLKKFKVQFMGVGKIRGGGVGGSRSGGDIFRGGATFP